MCMKRQIEYDKLFYALIFMCPLMIMLFCFSSGISGNDFWWHVKVGEYVVQTGNVPTSDIFSWYGTSVGLPWTAHEWLSDVIFYSVFHAFGAVGIFLLSLIGALGLYCLLWRECKVYCRKNILISGIFFSFLAIVLSVFFYGRPHIFSFYLLFFELKLLYYYYEHPNSKAIHLIPLIAVLWSNLHGGSSNLSYLLCILFLIVGLCGFRYGRIETKKMEKQQIVVLILVTLATIAGLPINPIGYRVLIYPYANLSDNLSMSVISEWQEPDAKQLGQVILYFLPIVFMAIGMIGEKKKVRLIDLLVMLAFLFLFFRSARFIILWYIAAVFYAFRYLPELKFQSARTLLEKATVWIILAVLAVCITVGVSEIPKTIKQGTLISKTMSDQAVAAIKEDKPERIFNDYNLGEALIYNEIPVFFDARADLYAQDNIMADGVSLMYLEQANKSSESAFVNVDELLKKYNFDAIVTLKTRPLYTYIISHPEQFEVVYEDDTVGYFRITGGQENG